MERNSESGDDYDHGDDHDHGKAHEQGQGHTDESGPVKRKRLTQACDPCRKKKIKCGRWSTSNLSVVKSLLVILNAHSNISVLA